MQNGENPWLFLITFYSFYKKILTLLKLDSDCSQASACLEPRLEERREA